VEVSSKLEPVAQLLSMFNNLSKKVISDGIAWANTLQLLLLSNILALKETSAPCSSVKPLIKALSVG